MVDGYNKNIEIWKLNKLIKELDAAKSNSPSMISLIMPPDDQISRATKILDDEYETASNVKSAMERQSVLDAITSAQDRLKLYNQVPPNGLVLYTGSIVADDGKEKKVTFEFEPFKPIQASLYICDNTFHTKALHELLEYDEKFGFIIFDDKGTLYGTLSGKRREVLYKFSADLPRERSIHGLRARRNYLHARHNYLHEAADLATQCFIDPATNQPNIAGLIVAGKSIMLDQRLEAKIIKTVDVTYGGTRGFKQAIELSAEVLYRAELSQEKKLIHNLLVEIIQETGKYVFGVQDTMTALEMGAVDSLIVCENLDVWRYALKNSATEETVMKYLNSSQEADQSNFRDEATSGDLDVIERVLLLEWLVENYKKYGCTLEFVTNRSQEGSQFRRGFGGIGGILHYPVNINPYSDDDSEDFE